MTVQISDWNYSKREASWSTLKTGEQTMLGNHGYYTREEACKALNISKSTLQRWMAAGNHDANKRGINPRVIVAMAEVHGREVTEYMLKKLADREKHCAAASENAQT